MPGFDGLEIPMIMTWSPVRMTRPDGSVYGISHFYVDVQIPGFDAHLNGGIEYPDGTVDALTDLKPELDYDPVTRRLKGGQLHMTLQSGEQRSVTIEPVSDTGFHLGTGLYMGFDGHHHGEWRGELNVEGERFDDCTDPETLRRIHQIRDCIIKVTDGDAVGYSILQSSVNGDIPALDLGPDSPFL